MSAIKRSIQMILIVCDCCGLQGPEAREGDASQFALRNMATNQGWWFRRKDSGDMFALCEGCRALAGKGH